MIVYTTDYREDPDRDGTATGRSTGEGCDHERTVYVEADADSFRALTCKDCGTTMPVTADSDGVGRSRPSGLTASCRWVLTRVGGRY